MFTSVMIMLSDVTVCYCILLPGVTEMCKITDIS